MPTHYYIIDTIKTQKLVFIIITKNKIQQKNKPASISISSFRQV